MIPPHKRKPLLTESEKLYQAGCRRWLAYVILMGVIGFVIGLSTAAKLAGCISWLP